jgi:hypothetical protein
MQLSGGEPSNGKLNYLMTIELTAPKFKLMRKGGQFTYISTLHFHASLRCLIGTATIIFIKLS